MSTLIGGLNVQSITNGYWFVLVEGAPSEAVPEVRGERVLIPGRVGLYTPAANFEDEHLTIRYHGLVTGTGANHAAVVASFDTRMAALMSACDVADREDITLIEGSFSAQAGFLRFVGPSAAVLGGEAREFEIEFVATDPPAWTAS